MSAVLDRQPDGLLHWLLLSMMLSIGLAAAGCGSKSNTNAEESESAALASEADSVADIEFVTSAIMDDSGFDEPLVAATIDIPANWVSDGGVFWDQSGECVSNYVRLKWKAESRDGGQAFEIMPGYNWQVQGTEIAMNPCPVLAIRSPRELLAAVAQRYSRANVLGYRDRPDLATGSVSAPQGGSAHIEAGEMQISYEMDDRKVHEVLTAALNITQLQGNVMIAVPAVYVQRAEDGSLNADIGERIRDSMRPDDQWVAQATAFAHQAIAQISQRQRDQIQAWHAQRMAEINARGAMDRSRIMAQTNREIAQIYSDTWASSQATDDRIHRRTLEAVGEYNTYADPASGGVVRESTQYDRVLRTEGGDYISTNDPYLNPAGTEELERVR